MCNCIICGLTKITHTIRTPYYYPPPIENVICPFCKHRGTPIYRRNDFYYSLFFIPLCPISRGKPYLSCENCKEFLGFSEVRYCSRCRTIAPSGYVFCTNCGENVYGHDLRDERI
ncbi:hypothetical protein DMUE_4930 [Dictyocoela muelleri]|nr:hypothetical protein DMUE_4930 [Dictyocoela muelleri]